MAAPPVGLAVGLAVWLVAAPGAVSGTPGLEARARAVAITPARAASGAPEAVAEAMAIPIFALTTGPGAVQEAVLKLEGISRSARRRAALVSIDGGPSQWLEVGEMRDGVMLRALGASNAVFDTPLGDREVRLGQSSSPDAAVPATGG